MKRHIKRRRKRAAESSDDDDDDDDEEEYNVRRYTYRDDDSDHEIVPYADVPSDNDDDDDDDVAPPPPPPAATRIPNRTNTHLTADRRAKEAAPPPPLQVNEQVPTPGCVSHPYLPIIAPDYSFVMDITDMRSLLINKFHKPEEHDADYNEIVNKVARVYSRRTAVNINHGYQYILTFVDTTSRKAWMYPQKDKGAVTTYTNFKKFLKDVQNKVARLLSDADTAFNQIRKNNDFFTYCSVTAAHNNHKTLGIIDRFTRTFRGLLYNTFRNFVGNYSWYDVYSDILEAYNNAKHDALFLRGHPRKGEDRLNRIKKFRYTPNQVWFNPRLRSRIRLRKYFDGYKNYSDGSLYGQIKAAEKVRIRSTKADFAKGGTDFFSSEIYDKGVKRGNAWWVNGKWVTYRNLLPANARTTVRQREANKQRKSKYHLGDYIRPIQKSGQPPRAPAQRFEGHRLGAVKETGELYKQVQQMHGVKDTRSAAVVGAENFDRLKNQPMILRDEKRVGHGIRFKRKRRRSHIRSKIFRKLKYLF